MSAATQSAPSTNRTKKDHTRRDELILEHLPLVTAIAAHVQRSLPVHTELDDLVHAGVMGLFDAASKYRDDKKVAFPTYAKHRIRGAILDGLRQLDWASRDLRKRHKQMETVTRELTTKLGRTPTQSELAAAMGLSSRRWQSLMVDFRSLGLVATQLRGTDRDEQPLNDAPSPAHSPDEVCARSEMREKLSFRQENPARAVSAGGYPVLRARYDDERNRRHPRSQREPRLPNPQMRSSANAECTGRQRHSFSSSLLETRERWLAKLPDPELVRKDAQDSAFEQRAARQGRKGLPNFILGNLVGKRVRGGAGENFKQRAARRIND